MGHLMAESYKEWRVDQLRIKDLEVTAYHDVSPAEKKLGQPFV